MRLQTGLKLEAALRDAAAAEGGHGIDPDGVDDAAQEAIIQEDDCEIEWEAFATLLQSTSKSQHFSSPPSSVDPESLSSSVDLHPSKPSDTPFCCFFRGSYFSSPSAAANKPPTAVATKIQSIGATTASKTVKVEWYTKMQKRLIKQPPCSMTIRILLPLLIPIALMVSYYAGRTYWTLSTNALLSQAKTEAMAAKMVQFAVAQLGFFARDLVVSCIPSRISFFASHMQFVHLYFFTAQHFTSTFYKIPNTLL